jgi:VWFA-related protein
MSSLPYRSRSRRALAAGLALLVLAAPLTGQQGPLPGVFGEVLEVRVINIEVVVTDKQGNRVPDLPADAFRLLVDGEEVPIEYFSEIRGGVAVAATDDAAKTRDVPSVQAGEQVGTSYLVFIDDYFSRPNDRKATLKALAADLDRLGPDDRMAIVAYDGRTVEMLTTWSNELPVLLRALDAANERKALGLQRLAEEKQYDLGRILEDSGFIEEGVFNFSNDQFRRLDPDERYYADRLAGQVERSVAAATATLRGFAQPPGRKVMLILSGGWPFVPAEFVVGSYTRAVFIEPGLATGDDIFRPLVDTANMLGYTLYPVDVPGLERRSFNDASRGTAPQPDAIGDYFVRENEHHFTLSYLANETGGEALLNAGRTRALRSVAEDTRSYYWLGFSPARSGDDREHEIEVRVDRPGLKVRSRKGFVDSSREREVSMAVESALLFGTPTGNEPLALRFGRPQKIKGTGVGVPLVVGIPLDAVTLLPVGDRWVSSLELRVAVLDKQGRQAEIPVIPVELAFDSEPPPGKYAAYLTSLQIRPRKHDVVVAIYDPPSGRILSGQAIFSP